MEKLSSGATTWVRAPVIGLRISRGVVFELFPEDRRAFVEAGDCTGSRGLFAVADEPRRSSKPPIGLGIVGAVSVEGNAAALLAFSVGREVLGKFSESFSACRGKSGSRRVA